MRNSSLERPKALRESSNDEDRTRRVNLIPRCNGSTQKHHLEDYLICELPNETVVMIKQLTIVLIAKATRRTHLDPLRVRLFLSGFILLVGLTSQQAPVEGTFAWLHE